MHIPRLLTSTSTGKTIKHSGEQTRDRTQQIFNNKTWTTRAHFTVGVTDKYQNGTEKTSAKSAFIAPTPKLKRFTYTEAQMDMDGR